MAAQGGPRACRWTGVRSSGGTPGRSCNRIVRLRRMALAGLSVAAVAIAAPAAAQAGGSGFNLNTPPSDGAILNGPMTALNGDILANPITYVQFANITIVKVKPDATTTPQTFF